MKEEGEKEKPSRDKRERFRPRDVGWRYSHWSGNGGSLEMSAKSRERLRFCERQTGGGQTSESWDVYEKLRKTQILSVSNWGRADFWVLGQSWRKPWRGTVLGLCVGNLCWVLSLFVMYKFVVSKYVQVQGAVVWDLNHVLCVCASQIQQERRWHCTHGAREMSSLFSSTFSSVSSSMLSSKSISWM